MVKNIFVFSMFVWFNVVVAQQDHTLFFMHTLPASNSVNPAIPILCNFYIGIPGMASTHFNYNNNSLKINDFFSDQRVNDSLRFDFGNAVSSIKRRAFVSEEMHLTLFTAGYRWSDFYLNFSITEKQNTAIMLPGDFARLAWDGNTQFSGEKLSLKGFRLNFNHYREYALGGSKQIDEDLRIGLKAKLLFGKSNIYTANAKGSLYTDNSTFALDGQSKATIKTSIPIQYVVDSAGYIVSADYQDPSLANYFLNRDNLGVAFDLGFIYKKDEKIEISGSLLNLGLIRWKSDANTLKSSGSIHYEGTTSDNVFSEAGDIENVMDSVMHIFGFSPTEGAYFSTLTPELYVGATYQVTNKLRAGALLYTPIYRNRIYPSVTFSANSLFFKYFTGSFSYTIQNNQFGNLGLGFGLKFGPLSAHLISDNVPGFFALDQTKNINFRLGVGLLFGCPWKKVRIKRDCECVGDPYGEQRWGGRKGKR